MMIIAVVSGTIAMGMFTMTKWEVERRLTELPEDVQKEWLAGTYKPRTEVEGEAPARE